MLSVTPLLRPALDPDFVPAALWNRAFRRAVSQSRTARNITLLLERPNGGRTVLRTQILPDEHPDAGANFFYVERLLKALLWNKGAVRVRIEGAPALTAQLSHAYSPAGARAFDHEFMGRRVYRGEFSIEAASGLDALQDDEGSLSIGRHLEGCRVGFDLGGSDRKAAAVIDGKVVFSEELSWDPYFQKDPAYHLEAVHESIARAAAHLPRVDAIGGSAAGVYVDNEVRVASLFRGVAPELFERDIRRMFFTLKERWNGVPFEVVNDGEVTALAGSMSLGANSVLGVSMGTSMAGGYVTPNGQITPWLNELAFSPIDYQTNAARDEWSGDVGCGVQYFSQQGVARLAERAGFTFPTEMPLAQRLVEVQSAMAENDVRAQRIYDTIGIWFGYSVSHYADFYDIEHLLVLGRVTSGVGGDRILDRAREVLALEFPELYKTVRLSVPDEKNKRHGQAVAAASLPALNPSRV